MAVTTDYFGPTGVYTGPGNANYSVVLPANITAADIVVVVIRAVNQTIPAAPAGWTMLGSTMGYANGGTTDTVRQYMFGKNTPAPADSSTTVTFVGGTVNGPMIYYSSVAFHVVSRSGTFVPPSTTAVTNNASSGVVIPSATATHSLELFVTGITMYGLTTGSLSTPGGLINVNGYDATGAVFYQERSNGQSNTSGGIGWGMMADTSSSAIVAQFSLALAPDTITETVGVNSAPTAGWNASTQLSDTAALSEQALRGLYFVDAVSDAVTLDSLTGAIYAAFSLVNMSDTIAVTSANAAATGYAMFDPTRSKPVYFNPRSTAGTYASASAAYNSWADALGVSRSDTDATFQSDIYSYSFIDLGFAPLYYGASTRVFISAGGNIHLFVQSSTDTTYNTTIYSSGFTSGTVSWPATQWPTQTPTLSFGLRDTSARTRVTSFKCKIVPSQQAAIFEIVFTSTQLGEPDPIRVALRLKAGFWELVTSPDASLIHSHRIQYVMGNDQYGTYTGGRIISTDLSVTNSFMSDDISWRLINVQENVTVFVPANVKIANWITGAALADDARLHGDPTVAIPQATADAVAVSDGIDWNAQYQGLLADTLRVVDSIVFGGVYKTALADNLRLVDATRRIFPVAQTDAIGVLGAVHTLLGVRILERLGLLGTGVANTKRYLAITELLRVSDALRRFLSGAVVDAVGVSQTQATKYNVVRQIAETVGILPALSNHLLLRANIVEGIEIADDELLKMIFNGQIVDGVQISAAYLRPGDDLTTWAVNTRTGAVTEYENFTFNSFAQSGHHYLGAAADGLYALDGSDDAGTPTIARLKSGYAQFNGSRFSAFKAAYLGMRGTGDFFFKIETGDGKSYTYKIVAQNMQTTKVRLGKGLRARYFAFELISTGQDFDLDNVEFVPMSATRRI